MGIPVSSGLMKIVSAEPVETYYVLSGDDEIWDLARKIQETYPEYREAME